MGVLAFVISLMTGFPEPAHATPRFSSNPARDELVRLPVTVHVAVRDGGSVAGTYETARWVGDANRALAPYGIRLDIRRLVRLPEGMATGANWRTRRALATRAVPDGTIHVFVLDRLDPPHRRARVRGLYWRYVGPRADLRGREYVAVSVHAPTSTLAHEIGHLLGLGHARSRENVMCACDRERHPAFSRDQGEQLRVAAVQRASARRTSAMAHR